MSTSEKHVSASKTFRDRSEQRPPVHNLDLNDIRFFAAAAQAGSLTAAAQELSLPTSTVSRAITRLEQHLCVLLVRRTSRGLVLTDSGTEYLQFCRRALRTLSDAGASLDSRRASPSGLIRIACPVTMAREVLAPLMGDFLRRYPNLRVEIEAYASNWHQEPRDEVDVFFKLRTPRDSARRVRPYPGTVRGLFASPAYVQVAGFPSTPDELVMHSCVGAGAWTLYRGKQVAVPDLRYRIMVSDPATLVKLATDGVGIALLPLFMARREDVREGLVPILPQWKPDPLTLCALFFGPSRLTPKVQALLNFLGEYLGTDRDPRLGGQKLAGLFAHSTLTLHGGR